MPWEKQLRGSVEGEAGRGDSVVVNRHYRSGVQFTSAAKSLDLKTTMIPIITRATLSTVVSTLPRVGVQTEETKLPLNLRFCHQRRINKVGEGEQEPTSCCVEKMITGEEV